MVWAHFTFGLGLYKSFDVMLLFKACVCILVYAYRLLQHLNTDLVNAFRQLQFRRCNGTILVDLLRSCHRQLN